MIKKILLCWALMGPMMAAAQNTYTVDPAATKVGWVGKKVTGEHNGSIQVKGGSLQWGTNGLQGGEVVVDMSTIKDLDMDEDGASRLEAHLNSKDFFNTSEFKTATFKITRVEKLTPSSSGQPNYTVAGDLTIKGITKPVTFQVEAWQVRGGVRAKGTLSFDRTLYGIKFRSGQFFDALGDRMIYDMIDLSFDLMAQ
ncbi:MAG TPA: YceI family protein [Flavobacteriales bacterium]|nr:YceI family protein [Flavobacteriales bacterium]